MAPTEVSFRQANATDLPAVAAVYLASRTAAMPAMPPMAHEPAEVVEYVASWNLDVRDLWLAEVDGHVAGFANLTGSWLDDLYVHPDFAGQGIGTGLLDVIKGVSPEGFCLWVFETNIPARDFYQRHGLVELERTDGQANEERSPDIKMAWPGNEPMKFFRGLIDGVDDQLAHLFAQRFALTHGVQGFKPTGGHAGRDLEREHQIAQRMAAMTGLPVQSLEPIVHTLIEQALDLHEKMEHTT